MMSVDRTKFLFGEVTYRNILDSSDHLFYNFDELKIWSQKKAVRIDPKNVTKTVSIFDVTEFSNDQLIIPRNHFNIALPDIFYHPTLVFFAQQYCRLDPQFQRLEFWKWRSSDFVESFMESFETTPFKTFMDGDVRKLNPYTSYYLVKNLGTKTTSKHGYHPVIFEPYTVENIELHFDLDESLSVIDIGHQLSFEQLIKESLETHPRVFEVSHKNPMSKYTAFTFLKNFLNLITDVDFRPMSSVQICRCVIAAHRFLCGTLIEKLQLIAIFITSFSSDVQLGDVISSGFRDIMFLEFDPFAATDMFLSYLVNGLTETESQHIHLHNSLPIITDLRMKLGTLSLKSSMVEVKQFFQTDLQFVLPYLPRAEEITFDPLELMFGTIFESIKEMSENLSPKSLSIVDSSVEGKPFMFAYI